MSRRARSWLCIALTLCSPLASAAVVIAARKFGLPGNPTPIGAVAAAIGSVVGVLLAPDSARSLPRALALIYGVGSLVVFAAAVAVGGLLLGLPRMLG